MGFRAISPPQTNFLPALLERSLDGGGGGSGMGDGAIAPPARRVHRRCALLCSGMLAEHFRCYKRVEYDPAKQAIVAVPDSGAAENHLPMSMPMAPEFTASATEQPYYTFSSEQANPASPMY